MRNLLLVWPFRVPHARLLSVGLLLSPLFFLRCHSEPAAFQPWEESAVPLSLRVPHPERFLRRVGGLLSPLFFLRCHSEPAAFRPWEESAVPLSLRVPHARLVSVGLLPLSFLECGGSTPLCCGTGFSLCTLCLCRARL